MYEWDDATGEETIKLRYGLILCFVINCAINIVFKMTANCEVQNTVCRSECQMGSIAKIGFHPLRA